MGSFNGCMIYYDFEIIQDISLIMLLVSEQTVKLKKTYQKILYLSAAAKGTYVFLGMPSTGRDVLVHCNKQGKILYEKVFRDGSNIDSFGMLSENEVAILESKQNRITILDLETHELTYFSHQFMFEEGDQSQIQTFADTRLLCVVERGRYNDHRFKLSYYSYPLKENQQPIAVYESKEDQWTYQYVTRKGNNNSLMIWYKQRGDQFLDIRTFSLRDHPKGIYQAYKIRNTIGQSYKLNKAQLAISNIWQSHKGELLAVCATNKTQLKAESFPGIVNNNFVIDLDKSTMREAKFIFDAEYNDYLIDYLNFGSFSMFRTFLFENGNVIDSPVYYVSNETESIIAREKWSCTYRTKYFIPGYDSSMIMQNEYQNGDVDWFTVKLKKIMDPKQIALHFMLHINDEFDDDLLQDALELLEQI